MIVASLFLLFTAIIVINLSHDKVFAHNFYKNEASVFFTLIKQFEVEKKLVQYNFPDNASLALEHAENSARLLKDIFYFNEDESDVGFRNTYDLMSKDLNSTTYALITANLADEVLKQYGLALGSNSTTISNLSNMSMSMNLPGNFSKANTSTMMMSMDSIDQQNSSNSQNVNTNITKQAEYQTATMLADSLKALFLHDLKNTTIPNSTGLMRIPMEIKSASVDDLGESVNNLISALSRKGPLDEIMSIVHGQIHSNVFMAFDLKLRSE